MAARAAVSQITPYAPPAAPTRMRDANSNSRAVDREALGALFFYSVLSFLFFGRGLVGHFSTWYIGRGPDSPQLIWFLAWWAYAIAHRINPFATKLLFAPVGASLAWATIVPLAALAALPTPGRWDLSPPTTFFACSHRRSRDGLRLFCAAGSHTAIGHRSPADGYSGFPRTSQPHCSRIST